jgi:hypothetical protein
VQVPPEVRAAALELLSRFPLPDPERPALGMRLAGSCIPCRQGQAPAATAAISALGAAGSSGAAGSCSSVSAVSGAEFVGPAAHLGPGQAVSSSELAMLAAVMWHSPVGDGRGGGWLDQRV